jgi:hypothetical protein
LLAPAGARLTRGFRQALGGLAVSVLSDRSSRPPSGAWPRTAAIATITVALAVLSFPALSWGHAERATTFPDPNQGNFPQYRTTGRQVVVCARDSRNRIRKIGDDAIRRANLQLLRRCRFHTIQEAVNYAQNNYRIEILPGVYREVPSLEPPTPDCQSIYDQVNSGNPVITYDQERQCPHAKNLIAIMGDTNDNGLCDSKCNLQIEGTGQQPEDVVIEGDRFSGPDLRLNAIRADRADGIYIKNLTTEYFDFNGIYYLETNGFVLDNVVSRWNREYGVLSFTSDHGIYEYCQTYGNGDSGVYPGSGPNGRHGQPDANGDVYGIIIHDCDSHDNLMGYSATAGNGTWSYHNRFHHNSAGTVTDAIVSGHPGMPPDHSKWSENLYYSNNKPLFSNGPIPVPPSQYTDDMTTGRDEYCKLPPNQRDLKVVCPSFFMPIGSGLLLAGANSDIVDNNYFFDNWRLGTALLYVPATLRGQNDPSRQTDVSNNNTQEGNCMGVRPAVLDPNQVDFSHCQGTHDPNGVDFWWDEEEGTDCPEVDQNSGSCVDAADGLGNCWSGNNAFNGGQPGSDPLVLPGCPGIDVPRPPNGSKSAFLVPCTMWDPQTNTDPAGCEMAGSSWFDVPPEPQP